MWAVVENEHLQSEKSGSKCEKMHWLNTKVDAPQEEFELQRLDAVDRAIEKVAGMYHSGKNPLKKDRIERFFENILRDVILLEEKYFKMSFREQAIERAFAMSLLANCIMIYLHIYEKVADLRHICGICEISMFDFWKFLGQLSKHVPQSVIEFLWKLEKELLLVEFYKEGLYFQTPSSDRVSELTFRELEKRR
jgi:hypothetical protein